MKTNYLLSGLLFCLLTIYGYSQAKMEAIAFGDFDRWLVREIKESSVIGGNIRYVYEVAPCDTVKGAIPYTGHPQSPWGVSNVMAKVSGVTKCSVTVFPEKRGDGWCARLETRMEECKVLGLINITVLASGSVFLGQMEEPIKETKNPYRKLLMGEPFIKRPAAMVMDYKLKASPHANRIKATGFSSQKEVPGRDYATVILFLQKRTEDANGNITATRVGTAVERMGQGTPDWVNGYRIPIRYGDITGDPVYQPYMGIMSEENAYYCRNSRGSVVPVVETGWAEAGESPTHIILLIASSHDSAYIGSVGNTLWVDNVKFAY